VTAATNTRLHLCSLSAAWSSNHCHTPELLNAKLTSWNPRHKLGPDGVVRVIDPTSAAPPLTARDAGRQHYLSLSRQTLWKYSILVDGNVGASRLGELAELQFLVFWVYSEQPQVGMAWCGLRAWVHYIPVRSDLSDLEAHLLSGHWNLNREINNAP
jgi:hypothetical protein